MVAYFHRKENVRCGNLLLRYLFSYKEENIYATQNSEEGIISNSRRQVNINDTILNNQQL